MIPHALFNSKGLFNPYQYEPFSKIFDESYQLNGQNLLITDEVGVGKTFEAGIILQEVIKNNSNSTILIICPTKLASQWQSELSENFDLHFIIYEGIQEQLTIVPYSQLGAISEFRYDVLVLDEAHYIRNNGSRLSAIRNLDKDNANPNALKVFMTATPIFNSENDFKNITGLLEDYKTTKTLQGEANLYDFQLEIKNNPVALNGISNEIIGEVMAGGFGKLTGFIKRVATSSIYSLKTFLENKEEFLNSDEYYFEEYEDDSDESQSIAENLLGLKDLCENFKAEDDDKLKVLNDLIESIKEDDTTNNGIVLFSTFINTGKYLQEKLKEKNYVYQISGQTSKKDINDAISKFKNKVTNGETAILICSDAFKEGQNFQFCDHLIHYDFPFTPAAIGQRNGRIYRTGREKGTKPTSYYITVNDSYDNRLFGEIIVEKSRVIKEHSDQGLISVLNILPSDSEEFLKNSLRVYFKERVSQRQGDDDKEKEKREFLYQIKKSFLDDEFTSNESDDISTNDPLLEEFRLKELLVDEDYIGSLVNIFSQIDTGSNLYETYKLKYDDQFSKINDMFFGDESNEKSSEKSSDKSNFIKSCDDYLSYKNIKESKFCHDMMREDAPKYSDYKNQFVALCEMEKEKDNE